MSGAKATIRHLVVEANIERLAGLATQISSVLLLLLFNCSHLLVCSPNLLLIGFVCMVEVDVLSSTFLCFEAFLILDVFVGVYIAFITVQLKMKKTCQCMI